MKDLTKEVTAVYTATTLDAKKAAMVALIENSHAKKETKTLAKIKVSRLPNPKAVDKFATNYMFSGEGMKV